MDRVIDKLYKDYVKQILDKKTKSVLKFIHRDILCKIESVEDENRNIRYCLSSSIQAQQVGLKNVYDKFIELENRQKKIEDLLKSGGIKELIDKIPKEEDINNLISNIEKTTEIGKLNDNLQEIRRTLNQLYDTFHY